MKAVKAIGEGKVKVVELPDPLPGRGQVRVKMQASGICGSDLGHVKGVPANSPDRTFVPGHEPCGIVDLLGEGVTHLSPGGRVTVSHYFGCGHCEHCYNGHMWWCKEVRVVGVGGTNGAHSDYIIADAVNCLPLPDEFSFEEGAIIACAGGTSYSALRKLNPRGGDSLAVIGLGPVGLAAVGLAAAMGAEVTAIGRRKARLRLARELGAAHVLDIDQEGSLKKVKDIYPEGVDMVCETAGTKAAHSYITYLLKRGGKAVLVGFGCQEPSLNLGAIIIPQITLMGSFVMPMKLYPDLVRLMTRENLSLAPMVTHRFSIEEGVEAYRMAYSKECGKVIFTW